MPTRLKIMSSLCVNRNTDLHNIAVYFPIYYQILRSRSIKTRRYLSNVPGLKKTHSRNANLYGVKPVGKGLTRP